MCGRYTLEFEQSIYPRFSITHAIELQSRYHVAPGQVLPVITEEEPDRFTMMKWGLIPFWEEKKEKPKGLLNLRDDTLINKHWGKKYLQSQRCLVPASGFFEWQTTMVGKVPYFFHLKGEKYFSFAGLFSRYENPTTGKTDATYSIITTRPNELLEIVHNRMPVILKREHEKEWLNPDNTEVEDLREHFKPYDESLMEGYMVSKAVNNPKNDSQKNIIAPGVN